MIDQSKLRAPGWQRIVADLSSPAPDDITFIARLTSALAQVAGARQGAFLAIGSPEAEHPSEPRTMYVWPPSASGQAPELEQAGDVRSAAAAAVESNQIRVFRLESGSEFYDATGQGFVIAVPVAPAPNRPPQGAITLLTESRSQQAMQTTLALVEVLAGYLGAHAARRELALTRAAGASLDLAAILIASINTAPNFKGALFQLTNDVARQLAADRVAVGWLKGRAGVQQTPTGAESIRVLAISDTEHIDRRMDMVRRLEAAMDECLDQEQPVVYPPPPERGEEADVLLAQAIVHAHRELAAGDATIRLISLPLRIDERVLGVVTIETPVREGDKPIDLGVIEMLQAVFDLITPVLRIRLSDDRPLPLRATDTTVKAAGWVVGPKHTVWKLIGLAVMALAFVVVFVRAPYRIEAPMELAPGVKQIVSAPFEGIIKSLPEGVKPDKEVKPGELLVQLDDAELRLRAAEQRGQVLQAQTEADAYLKEGKLAEARQATAQRDAAQAALDLTQLFISQAEVRAPIKGRIITGELEERIGGKVERGEALFEIAPLEELIIKIRVDDRDIRFVEEGMHGQIARKARPSERIPIMVERIVPLARPEEGKNVFEVWARLDPERMSQADRRQLERLRPGMEGLAKLDTGRKSLAWIGSRRILDTLRLWLWW